MMTLTYARPPVCCAIAFDPALTVLALERAVRQFGLALKWNCDDRALALVPALDFQRLCPMGEA